MDERDVGTLHALADAVRELTGAGSETALRAAVAGMSFPGAGLHRLECADEADEIRVVQGDDSAAGRALLDVLAPLLAATVRRLRQPVTSENIYFEQLFAGAPEAIVVLDGEDRVVRGRTASSSACSATPPPRRGPHHQRADRAGGAAGRPRRR
jgi:hypothetical protein